MSHISGHSGSWTSRIEISLKIYSQNLYMDAEDHESNAEKDLKRNPHSIQHQSAA